jgi:hypothetical protein
MKRTTLKLTLTVCSLALTAAANADDKVLKQVIAPNNQSLDLPPVLAPNDGFNPQQVVINEPQLNLPQQAPVQVQQLVVDPTQPNQLAYFSPRLGCRFLIQPMFLPQFGNFLGARIVSEPELASPLRQLGLDEGDVITRLDGLPVTNVQELERHILDTGVRFIHAGEQVVHKGTMFINPHQFFVDPYNPGCNHQCGNVALRP